MSFPTNLGVKEHYIYTRPTGLLQTISLENILSTQDQIDLIHNVCVHLILSLRKVMYDGVAYFSQYCIKYHFIVTFK